MPNFFNYFTANFPFQELLSFSASHLILKGSNTLPDLSFVKEMPKLQNLHLTMNVEDGNLSICEQLPYVRIKNRKHYSHQDDELPKNYTDPNVIIPFEIMNLAL